MVLTYLYIYIIGAIVIQFTSFLSFFSSYIDAKELFHFVEFPFALLAIPVIKAEVEYPNAEASKTQILKDNKGKSGIYRWTNLTNGKTYVGSSLNLSIRFNCYYNVNRLSSGSGKNMLICKALLK